MQKVLNKIYSYRLVFSILLVLVFFHFFQPINYLQKDLKNRLKLSNKKIDSLQSLIYNYKPDTIYIKKRDSLVNEIKKLNTDTYEKDSIIYFSNDFNNKFDLLTNRLSKDTIK